MIHQVVVVWGPEGCGQLDGVHVKSFNECQVAKSDHSASKLGRFNPFPSPIHVVPGNMYEQASIRYTVEGGLARAM
jgi:hypothetical protein